MNTGLLSKIGDYTLFPNGATFDLGASGFDQATGVLYQLQQVVKGQSRDVTVLYAVDTRNGSALPTSVDTGMDPASFFQSVAFSMKERALYGMMADNRLGKMDVVSGAVQSLGSPVAAGSMQWAFWHGVIDEDAGLFYTSMQKLVGGVGAGPSQLVALNVVTGKLALMQQISDPLMYMSLVSAD